MFTVPIANTTLRHNKELASIFRKMSDCYKYLGPDNRFRAIAYETAAKTLSNMSEPVDVYGNDIKKLDELKGVGEGIAQKIIEYLQTGAIQTFEKLQQEVPYKLLELMDIEGIGPATVRMLHDKLNVNSKEELITAIENGKLQFVKGFGKKKIDNLVKVLKLHKDENKRLPFNDAFNLGNKLLLEVKKIPGVLEADLAGSIRRKKDTIGDIDIIVTAAHKNWKKIITRFTQLPQVNNIIASGETKASVALKEKNVQADIRVVHEDEYGAALLYFTGSKEHNIQLRTMAKNKGWKINEYGVFDAITNKRLAGETEEGIYLLFGLPYIEPEKRIGKDELQMEGKVSQGL
jgi:DNA polymerase (family 10)